MTQKDKELLLRDLSSRLPYGVLCDIGLDHPLPLQRIFVDRLEGTLLDFYEDGLDYQVYISEVKPYLFPLYSMTEEQEREYLNTCNGYCTYYWTDETFDWLNEHHFDYRHLIEKGLALTPLI